MDDRRFSLLIALAWPAISLFGQNTTTVAPSARFPAEWYSDNQIMATMPPVIGAPYVAREVTGDQLGRVPLEEASLQARDSAGRTRTESGPGPRTAPDGTQVMVREVGVTDPVSQCSFQWEEPWALSGPPSATVQCQRHKAEYAGEPLWAYPKVGEEHPSPYETDETEPIGERMFDGVRAVGFRRVRTIKGAMSDQTQVIDADEWTSPEMKEIVAIYVKSNPSSSVELKNIKLGEPDAKLFYPPAGTRSR